MSLDAIRAAFEKAPACYPVDLRQRIGLYQYALEGVGVAFALMHYEALPPEEQALDKDEVYAVLASVVDYWDRRKDAEAGRVPAAYNLALDRFT